MLFGFMIAASVPSRAVASDKDIVETAIAAGNVKTLATALTEAGLRDVKIVVKNKNVMINAAKVVRADIESSNGVIHAIALDAVTTPIPRVTTCSR